MAFVIAWFTNTECDIANLNSALVAPACLTHHDTKTADHGTVVQLLKENPISTVHFLICLHSNGSASFVNWNLLCCSWAIEASLVANGVAMVFVLSEVEWIRGSNRELREGLRESWEGPSMIIGQARN